MTPERREFIIRQLDAGKTPAQISQMGGGALSAVRKICHFERPHKHTSRRWFIARYAKATQRTLGHLFQQFDKVAGSQVPTPENLAAFAALNEGVRANWTSRRLYLRAWCRWLVAAGQTSYTVEQFDAALGLAGKRRDRLLAVRE